MNYIICGSYRPLLFALHLKNLGEKITLITWHENVIKYCIAEDINYIKYKRIRPTRPTIGSIYKLYVLKKMFDDMIKKIDFKDEDRFFLTGNANAYEFFYLAKELSKKIVVYYKFPDKKYNIYKHPKFKPIFIRGFIFRILIKIILDLDLMYYETHNVPRYGIDDAFLKKYNMIEYNPSLSSGKICLDAMEKSKNRHKKYDNLIIDQGEITNGIKFDSIKNIYKNLLKIPNTFALKKHPDVVLKSNKFNLVCNNIFKNCEELPDYIPAELLCNNINKNVISFFSASLIPMSQIQHLNAISLLELVEWTNISFKNEVKEWLVEESNNKILFPKTFEELEKILLEK